jgi:hypothetical protein
VQAAAACRTRLFSSAVNLRLFAFAVTSVCRGDVPEAVEFVK